MWPGEWVAEARVRRTGERRKPKRKSDVGSRAELLPRVSRASGGLCISFPCQPGLYRLDAGQVFFSIALVVVLILRIF